MAKQYQVVGACVTDIPTGGPMGPTRITLLTDAFLPPDVPAERIEHLLSVGLIKEVADPAAPAAEEEGSEPVKTVTSRSSKQELIDYGVTCGDDRAELEALTRDQLLDRYVRQQ
ncbi:hypothetical protein [Streptosporangium saharense]|uniref:hypothetical protein n=1 Tax=Streptosporangium saharense TaxID=1706840 RepID=UPI00332FEE07